MTDSINDLLIKNIKNGSTVGLQNLTHQSTTIKSAAGNSFGDMLREQLAKNDAVRSESQIQGLQFSKHAQQRVEQRGIEITEDLMNDLNSAVSRARDKGSKDVVVIDRNGAFIVNIPNNTVITAMSGSEMRENIFTNIDSAVIV